MKERKRFLLYYDWENLIQDMTDIDIASLTRSIFKYQNTGEISDMTYGAKLAFAFMRPVFDEDRKDWEETSKTNSDNAKKRWDKRKSETMRPHTTVSEPMRASTDSVSGIDSVIVNDTDIIETDTIVSSQAIVAIEKIDRRNPGTQRIIDIVQSEIQNLGYLYEKHAQDRNRATIISKRQSDWGDFIGDSTNEREEQVIRQIVNYSNSNEFVKKIRSAYDFHEKWKSVANAMKQSISQVQEYRTF